MIETTAVQQDIDQILQFLLSFVIALVIFIAFWIISIIIRRLVRRYGKHTRLDNAVISLITQLINVVILTLGTITALGTIGVDVSALVAGLGLTSFALGFALQDILSNVLSGVLLLVYRPFRLGNYVRVGANEGHVVAIDLRYTTLRTPSQYILIPNQVLFKESIIVLSAPPGSNLPPPGAPINMPPAPPPTAPR